MIHRFSMLVVPAVLTFAMSSAPCRAEDKADPKMLEAQMEKLLDAYNRDDVKAFFADWSKQSAAITTPEVYDALYKMGAKSQVGNYVAKTVKLHPEGSVLDGEILVVYFDCEFANAKQGLATANFQKEDGGYKFIQVLFGKKE